MDPFARRTWSPGWRPRERARPSERRRGNARRPRGTFMRGRMLYDPVRLANGARIHLFKVDRGALEDDREADRIATKLRERLFAAHRPPAVVIMESSEEHTSELQYRFVIRV